MLYTNKGNEDYSGEGFLKVVLECQGGRCGNTLLGYRRKHVLRDREVNSEKFVDCTTSTAVSLTSKEPPINSVGLLLAANVYLIRVTSNRFWVISASKKIITTAWRTIGVILYALQKK